MSWVLAFLGFALLIILHELGHFFAAKAVGMRVERFSLFFPPLLARHRRGETEYAVGAIPLGGYVKITGMNPAEEIPPAVAHRAYYRQPVWKRIFVIGAGPAVNIVLAFLILWALLWANGINEPKGEISRATTPPALGALQPGDRLVSVDGVRGDFETLREQISSHKCADQSDGCKAATPATIVVLRDGQERTVELAPVYNAEQDGMFVGFEVGTTHRDLGPGEAADESVTAMWSFTTRTISTIAGVFEAEKRKQISGVVGSYNETRKTLRAERRAGDLPAGRHLAVARRHQPVPVPAARRRPHLLGAGREGPRPRDPLQRDGAGRVRRLRARDRAVHGRVDQRRTTG